ncbi:L,D-transpeptidase family protein [Cesiribacter andamanensis]|uniref:Murein L,D-transpeptidase n=1 Tax=Cesiribacter andamanensis AMV16 TaxID=1279009 RepID=M7NP68_9BACT|nr:L,D-transpeptidase family protein [Cesiribacter andamanensis]EMR03520.1 murein L,D-transpeptidase [Cesiribacter andamanensis AMV16]
MKKQFKSYTILLALISLLMACTDQRKTEEQSGERSTDQTETPKPVQQQFAYAPEQASQHIRQWLDSSGLAIDLPKIEEGAVAQDLHIFYSERNFQPAWTPERADELVTRIENIQQEGLNPNSYPLDSLRLLVRQASDQENPKTGAQLDILLSATYLKLADVIATGKVKPGDFFNSWHIKPLEPDTLYTHLQDAVAGHVDASLDYFRPQFDQYEKLQHYLNRYTRLVNEGGWPRIDEGNALAPGDSSQRLVAIRQRLHLTGDLETAPAQGKSSTYYDAALENAVNRYQARNGLPVQPEITSQMIAAMNVPAEERLQQLMLNLDRIRWFASGEMDKTYVLVNIPEYRLRVYEGGREIKKMKVVVGKQMNATPIFSDQIDHVVFSPYWNVPTSIATEEIIPKARNNPSYLERNKYELLNAGGKPVVPSRQALENFDEYRIRQKPGPWNALGSVKFMFPNDFAIYLHDTPQEHLFERSERAFSHGCIRIEEPDWMADWLLPQLNRQQVRSKLEGGRREVVQLKNKVPVYIFYLTAFEDTEGRLNFREDLYQLDERLKEQFNIL